MRNLRLSPVLILLALMATGCAEASDPAADTGSDAASDSAGGDVERDVERDATPDAGGDTGPLDTGDDTAADAGTDESADTTDPDAGPETGDDGGASDAAGDVEPDPECGTEPFFAGQVFGTEAPNGGAPIFVAGTDAFAYPDANLSALAGSFPEGTPDEPVGLEIPVRITEATVVATSYITDAAIPPSQATFWVADSSGTVEVRLDYTDADAVPAFQIRVGHRISFDVNAVSAYFGTGQIAAASNWELASTDNEVYILERTGVALTTADIGHMVRVEGTLTANNGDCGGSSTCWDLDNGGGEPVLFRSASTFHEVGQCLTYVGPLSVFSGAPQINVINFDWVWTYGD